MTWLILPAVLLAIAGLALLDITVLRRHGSWTPAWRTPKYSVLPKHWLPTLLGSDAVTINNRVLLRKGVTPSAYLLAHEYGHVLHTSWTRYVWSRITGGEYHGAEEAAAHAYAAANDIGFYSDATSLGLFLNPIRGPR